MNKEQIREVTRNVALLEDAAGFPADKWVGHCHEVSLALVKSGLIGPSRVARGWAGGVSSQHSWAVAGTDVYDHDAIIVDATHPAMHKLWAASPKGKGGTPVLVTDCGNGREYSPAGWGVLSRKDKAKLKDIMPPLTGTAVELEPKTPFSPAAKRFLALIGPMDMRRWMWLASNMPMQGWPAKEIIEAMADNGMGALVPIDIMGMLTDRNPNGLYLAGDGDHGAQLRMAAREEGRGQ